MDGEINHMHEAVIKRINITPDEQSSNKNGDYYFCKIKRLIHEQLCVRVHRLIH